LRPHILTLSQIVDDELIQKGEHEEINPSSEFAENNSNFLAKVLVPKRKANRASTLDTNY
jgi:hypothetical protein